MSVFLKILNDPSITAVVSGAVLWVLAHLTGLIKVLEGGNISVQQVAAAEKAVVAVVDRADPELAAELKAKLAEVEQRAQGLEAEVQAKVAAELQHLCAGLVAATPGMQAVPPQG